jgi:hypothetical protein
MNYVLAFILTVAPGENWTANLKFESYQDCKMVSNMTDLIVRSGKAESIDKKQDCEAKQIASVE